MFSEGLTCFEFSSFWNVIRKWFSLVTKIIVTLGLRPRVVDLAILRSHSSVTDISQVGTPLK